MPAHILIVDDDPAIRTLLIQILAPHGYHLTTATDGLEALQRVAMDQPDLVLLDVSLPPGPNGYEVCRRIKADEHTALIPVTMLTVQTGLGDRQRSIDAGADDYLTKPVNAELLEARIRSQLRIKQLTDQLERTEQIIFMLARAVAARDNYTAGHLQRLADYSEQLARAAGLPAWQIKAIRYGGLLHDIGKIRIHDTILRKPGPLTPAEYDQFKRHPEYGAEIIAHMRFAPTVVPIILSHHEQWDGDGYPQRLRGSTIPIGARIVAIVDAFDAMTTNRPYRHALSPQEALRRLRAGSGRQWDASLVDIFAELAQEGQLTISSHDWSRDCLTGYTG